MAPGENEFDTPVLYHGFSFVFLKFMCLGLEQLYEAVVLLFYLSGKTYDGKHALPTSTALIISKMGKYDQLCSPLFQNCVLSFVLICTD